MRILLFAALAILASGLACSAVPDDNVQPKAAPVVESVFPADAAVGSSDFMLSLSGKNFSSRAKVLWNGERLKTYASDQQIYAIVPKKHLAAPGKVAVTVQNSPESNSDPVTFTISASGPSNPTGALGLATVSLSEAHVGSSYRGSLVADGGTPPYTWSMPAGALPSGIVLSATTGKLSGAPTAAGKNAFTVQVNDAAGHTASKQLNLSVQSTTPSIVTDSIPSVQVNSGYSASLKAQGGAGPYTWTLTGGSLPAGLSLSRGGQITGSAKTAGANTFTVQVQDAVGQTATQTISLNVKSISTLVQGLFAEDFEDGKWSGYYTADPSHQTIVDSSEVPGGCLAGNKCGQIQTVRGGTGGQLWRALYSSSVNQAIYMQFYVKFQSDFLWGTDNCGTNCAGGSNNMKLVYFQSNGLGNSKLYFEASGVGTQTPGGSSKTALWQAMTDEGQNWMNGGSLIGDGQWHKVKIKVDKPNRQITYWIDDVRKGPWSDPTCGGGCSAWNELGIGLYNNNRWPQAQKAWFDNVVVSTTDPK